MLGDAVRSLQFQCGSRHLFKYLSVYCNGLDLNKKAFDVIVERRKRRFSAALQTFPANDSLTASAFLDNS